jgi:hypothetical protein
MRIPPNAWRGLLVHHEDFLAVTLLAIAFDKWSLSTMSTGAETIPRTYGVTTI